MDLPTVRTRTAPPWTQPHPTQLCSARRSASLPVRAPSAWPSLVIQPPEWLRVVAVSTMAPAGDSDMPLLATGDLDLNNPF